MARMKPIPIRIRLSATQEQKLIACHEANHIKCSVDLFAQTLLNKSLDYYYDTLVKHGKIKGELK